MRRSTPIGVGSAHGIRLHNPTADLDTAEVRQLKSVPGMSTSVQVGETIALGAAILTVQPREASAPPSEVAPAADAGFLVCDEAMLKVYALAARIAQGPISVLLLGETGVGKEVLAEFIHRRSPRSAAPFLRLNCAALSESLLESELFGHEKGAFTGAVNTKRGLFESAEGGTVFLDEVGELPMAIQMKLLRVLEDRQVTRVGGLAPRPVDVRFVAATNRDLAVEIEKGTFRQDLFFRLDGISLTIPPLRVRPSEIGPIARVFAARAAARLGRPVPVLSREVLSALERHAWPGNVRELRNVLERAMMLSERGEILPEHLLLSAAAALPRPVSVTGAETGAAAEAEAGAARMRSEIGAIERRHILDALEAHGGKPDEGGGRAGDVTAGVPRAAG